MHKHVSNIMPKFYDAHADNKVCGFSVKFLSEINQKSQILALHNIII